MWSTGLQSTGHPQVAGILALLALRNSALSTAGTGPAELSAVKCCLCPLLVRPKLQPFSTESIPAMSGHVSIQDSLASKQRKHEDSLFHLGTGPQNTQITRKC